MGLFSFIKEAGEKLFGSSQPEATPQQGSTAPAAPATDQATLNARAAAAIAQYIHTQNLGLTDLAVQFDAASGSVTLTGQAPTKEAAEKATLAAGNVQAVQAVHNQLHVQDTTAADAQYHDVMRGDTLSAIAKKYYGDASKYPIIFEANRPMLSHPDKIYPGQKLRIPAL